MSRKGSQFERDLCVEFSEWFSYGKREDLFWRTGGSGARATVRHKAGKQTTGQHGDIGLSDPAGKPLLDVFTFSLKRGYKGVSIHDLFDMPPNNTRREWERWITEARTSAFYAGSYTWAIIAKRDRRDALFVTPLEFFNRIGGGELASFYANGSKANDPIGIQRLKWFFQISPQEIKDIAQEHDS